MRVGLSLVVAAWLVSCGSGGSNAPAPCASSDLPATVHLGVAGFAKCNCFNGNDIVLTKAPKASNPNGYYWVSAPIDNCPGQLSAAYLKLSLDPSAFGLGITDSTSDPGSGNSDLSPVTGGTCSPLDFGGLGASSGNINEFCPGGEDTYMKWFVKP